MALAEPHIAMQPVTRISRPMTQQQFQLTVPTVVLDHPIDNKANAVILQEYAGSLCRGRREFSICGSAGKGAFLSVEL